MSFDRERYDALLDGAVAARIALDRETDSERANVLFVQWVRDLMDAVLMQSGMDAAVDPAIIKLVMWDIRLRVCAPFVTEAEASLAIKH